MGLFTLLPPSPSPPCTPSPTPTATHSPNGSAALSFLSWSALGACLGVVAALGAAAGVPRLRAWLAQQQQTLPLSAERPAFSASDYAQLN